MVKGWLRNTQGKETKPTGKHPKAPTEAEQEKLDAWEENALRAAGEIYLSLSDYQKTDVQGCLEDPVKMWATLESVHLQKKPGMRFNAWEEFFSVHMEESDSLSSLMTRVDAAMQRVKNLRPDTFTPADLDKELVSMTLIRALPSSYAHFASSLQLLNKLNKDALQAAFINEEALRSRTSTPGTTAVLSTSTSQALATDASLGAVNHSDVDKTGTGSVDWRELELVHGGTRERAERGRRRKMGHDYISYRKGM
ncbi:hypothetical protein PsYK624_168390 [Phanerochaete sordida]|uniref:Uncharacterized protein n=1 Tax=Phanerochaete sordida TaxID=48140 RepID=A0A9P3GXS7_9APHY|nr:hypothetical protein PsYK624_168390 [Phanerochaete sordida]